MSIYATEIMIGWLEAYQKMIIKALVVSTKLYLTINKALRLSFFFNISEIGFFFPN